ncbi:glycosyltransferase [Fictibacillus macauensis]|uniref:glycosyltransferase n=1 Tax=Fictibacillus macauensis TaxID=245160 RepID=UPI0003094757|nr:glycosyltransferase [Fictibacillus macauensis]
MITISLCMIVKNEEAVLERCLCSVQDVVDEIIIVDTGSTDDTLRIAQKYTEHIVPFQWQDDFALARNFSFSHASKEYILWLDADDVFHKNDLEAFIQLKKNLSPEVDSVQMNYHLAFDQRGQPTKSIVRNRLVKRACQFKWQGVVHEYLEVSGVIVTTELSILHKKEKAYNDRNLKIYHRYLESGQELSVRDMFYYGNELLDHSYWEEAISVYTTFLDCKEGWVEDRISACLKLAKCYEMLYETEEELECLVRSFIYDVPRPEVCCRLGAIYLEGNHLRQAIYWYEQALERKEQPLMKGITHNEAAWSWLPHLQLTVCYEKVNNRQKAMEHHKEAMRLNDSHSSILSNEMFFQRDRQEQKL